VKVEVGGVAQLTMPQGCRLPYDGVLSKELENRRVWRWNGIGVGNLVLGGEMILRYSEVINNRDLGTCDKPNQFKPGNYWTGKKKQIKFSKNRFRQTNQMKPKSPYLHPMEQSSQGY
jgi:hypothetical protein